jgi:hypothetical protein
VPRLWVIQTADPGRATRGTTKNAALAHGTACYLLGQPAADDCLEADQLKLSKEKIPLDISLAEPVLQQFADDLKPAVQQPMEWEELLGYIRAIEDFDQHPLEGVLSQTEIIGDPALPKPAERAVLRWVGASFDAWEQGFPLETQLMTRLRALKPVLARAALSEAAFFKPGHHPLHQLLDALHDAAVGWQPDLGRAGEPVIALFDDALGGAREWLDSGNARLPDIAASAMETARRSKARADRMALRAVESERGRHRSTRARTTAATTINDILERLPVPQDIGRVIKGPWYDSAQLVLLKFGEDSEEWRAMRDTTESLADSMQPLPEGDDARKRELLNAIARLPTDIRRWMLSLQHDSDSLDQVLSTLEYAQLRVMRHQPPDSGPATPIALEAVKTGTDTGDAPAGIVQGDWFLVGDSAAGARRVQLAMLQDGELLFCNQAGLKVMGMRSGEFADMLQCGSASPLPSGASFSRAMLLALGIDSDAALAALAGEPEPPPPAIAPAVEPAADASAAAPAQVSDEPVRLPPDPVSAPVLPESDRPELPLGTWLGFHDVDPPLLAKLALHDKVRRLLIFVNRKGVELRRLGEEEYFSLISDGQVDIMEASNNFREQVERARARLQRHQT